MEFTGNQNVDRTSKFYMSEECGVFIEKELTLKTAFKTSVLLSIIHILTKKQRGIGMTALRAISNRYLHNQQLFKFSDKNRRVFQIEFSNQLNYFAFLLFFDKITIFAYRLTIKIYRIMKRSTRNLLVTATVLVCLICLINAAYIIIQSGGMAGLYGENMERAQWNGEIIGLQRFIFWGWLMAGLAFDARSSDSVHDPLAAGCPLRSPVPESQYVPSDGSRGSQSRLQYLPIQHRYRATSGKAVPSR